MSDKETENPQGKRQHHNDDEDIIEERRRKRLAILEKYRGDDTKAAGAPPVDNDNVRVSPLPRDKKEEDIIPSNQQGPSDGKDDDDDDDDDDDMFAVSDEKQSTKPRSKNPKRHNIKAITEDGMMVDNIDDPDGYYKVIIGDILNKRYKICSQVGRGMFGSVVGAEDILNKKQQQEIVAVKILRNNETIYKAGQHEIEMLEKIGNKNKNIIQLYTTFEYKNHLCLIFEMMNLNLRQVVKKFGFNIGLNIDGVKIYSKQILNGLNYLKQCEIIHCDIKPDNILVCENFTIVKICDLGSSILSSTSTTTNELPNQYLVSRFYRCPEIILGLLPFNSNIDIWSFGCTIFEIFTDEILFPGNNNNHMIFLIFACIGKMSNKLLNKCQFKNQFFNLDGLFISTNHFNNVTEKISVKLVNFPQYPHSLPGQDLKSKLINKFSSSSSSSPSQNLLLFIDFLHSLLNINPDKRLSPSQALSHPFLTSSS